MKCLKNFKAPNFRTVTIAILTMAEASSFLAALVSEAVAEAFSVNAHQALVLHEHNLLKFKSGLRMSTDEIEKKADEELTKLSVQIDSGDAYLKSTQQPGIEPKVRQEIIAQKANQWVATQLFQRLIDAEARAAGLDLKLSEARVDFVVRSLLVRGSLSISTFSEKVAAVNRFEVKKTTGRVSEGPIFRSELNFLDKAYRSESSTGKNERSGQAEMKAALSQSDAELFKDLYPLWKGHSFVVRDLDWNDSHGGLSQMVEDLSHEVLAGRFWSERVSLDLKVSDFGSDQESEVSALDQLRSQVRAQLEKLYFRKVRSVVWSSIVFKILGINLKRAMGVDLEPIFAAKPEDELKLWGQIAKAINPRSGALEIPELRVSGALRFEFLKTYEEALHEAESKLLSQFEQSLKEATDVNSATDVKPETNAHLSNALKDFATLKDEAAAQLPRQVFDAVVEKYRSKVMASDSKTDPKPEFNAELVIRKFEIASDLLPGSRFHPEIKALDRDEFSRSEVALLQSSYTQSDLNQQAAFENKNRAFFEQKAPELNDWGKLFSLTNIEDKKFGINRRFFYTAPFFDDQDAQTQIRILLITADYEMGSNYVKSLMPNWKWTPWKVGSYGFYHPAVKRFITEMLSSNQKEEQFGSVIEQFFAKSGALEDDSSKMIHIEYGDESARQWIDVEIDPKALTPSVHFSEAMNGPGEQVSR